MLGVSIGRQEKESSVVAGGSEMKTIQIGDHVIGPDYPTYIIAEVGINHNDDPYIVA